MTVTRLTLVLAIAGCTAETTSFRTTDRGDGEHPGAAAYAIGGASVHVWSGGGYIGSSDEPMTHVGFAIRNAGTQPVVFDGDALALTVFAGDGAPIPGSSLVAVTPLGPAQVSIAPGDTAGLDAYFLIAVRPRVVDHMQVRWALRHDDTRQLEVTSFVRDDELPVVAPPSRPRS